MKKIKLMLLALIAIILTGCTANYEISIYDNKITENVKIVETDTSLFDKRNDTGWTPREIFASYVNDNRFDKKNYTVKSIDSNNELGLEYNNSDLTSILNSSFLNLCYKGAAVSETDGIVNISTGTSFECFDYYDSLDTIKVVFKTNHKVKSTNSDEKHGDTYIWNISKDSNKDIQISYYKSVMNNSVNVWLIVLIIVALIGLGIGIYSINKKNKKENEI